MQTCGPAVNLSIYHHDNCIGIAIAYDSLVRLGIAVVMDIAGGVRITNLCQSCALYVLCVIHGLITDTAINAIL